MKKLLLIAICSILFPLPVEAQSFSISLEPSYTRIVTAPENRFTIPITLSNLGDPQTVELQLVRLYPNNTSDNAEILGYGNNALTEPVIRIENSGLELRTPFLLYPKARHNFDLDVEVSSLVPEDDYLIGLSIKNIIHSRREVSTLDLEAQLLSTFLISIAKETPEPDIQFSLVEIHPMLQIGDWSIIDMFSKPQLTLRIQNTSLHAAVVEGEIISTWSMPLYSRVSTYSIPQQVVYKESQRLLATTGHVSGTSILSRALGRHTTDIFVHSGDKKIVKKLNYIVFPWKMAIVVAAMIGVLGLRKLYT